MSRLRLLTILAVAFVLAFALVREAGLRAHRLGSTPTPSFRISHTRHASVGVGCVQCHADVRTGPGAGLPSASTCLECHRFTMPKEPAWLDSLRTRGPDSTVAWLVHVRLPDDIRFDHARHASVSCTQCHGSPAVVDANPQQGRQSMTSCLQCHTTAHAAGTKVVSQECTACHR